MKLTRRQLRKLILKETYRTFKKTDPQEQEAWVDKWIEDDPEAPAGYHSPDIELYGDSYVDPEDVPYEFGEEEIAEPGYDPGLLGDPELADPDHTHLHADEIWADWADRDVKKRATRPRRWRTRHTPRELKDTMHPLYVKGARPRHHSIDEMKLTRRKLRKLIHEAVINEMPMIKPGGDIDPEHYEKLTGMIDTGDEESIIHADQLASMVGHDSENFSKDLDDYDMVPIMGNIGDIQQYLSREDLRKLYGAYNKNLTFDLSTWEGWGFWDKRTGAEVISPLHYEMMATQITLKKPSVTDEELEEMAGEDETINALQLLAKRIMRISKTTTINEEYLDEMGIGEESDGSVEFWDQEYEKLYIEKKLIISGETDLDSFRPVMV